MKINKTIFGLMFLGATPFAIANDYKTTTTTESSSDSSYSIPSTSPSEYPKTTTRPQTTAGVTPEDMAKSTEHGVIRFERGSAKLTEAQRSELRNLVDKAKAEGPIKQVQVGVWSDKEFPIQTNKDLPKADRHLAEQRGDTIKKFMKDDLKVDDVTIHNMAKAPGALARAFNTEDAELKSLFARKSPETTKTMPENKEIAQELVLFRDYGKPSTAVVVIDHKSK